MTLISKLKAIARPLVLVNLQQRKESAWTQAGRRCDCHAFSWNLKFLALGRMVESISSRALGLQGKIVLRINTAVPGCRTLTKTWVLNVLSFSICFCLVT